MREHTGKTASRARKSELVEIIINFFRRQKNRGYFAPAGECRIPPSSYGALMLSWQ
jgi:hypothetical protein